MGCGSGGGTNTVTSSSQPPQWLQDDLQSLYGQAQTITSQPLSQYGGQTIAGFTPDQTTAMNTVNQSQGVAQPYYNQAQQLITNASQPITPSTINAQTIAQYQSPYQQQVIDATQKQLNQNDAVQQQQLLGQAIQSGASPFGGDRAGVAAAALAGQQSLANNQTIAGLENQGYTQALGEANTQQQAQLSAQEASQYLGQQGGFGLTNLGTTAENTGLAGASAQLQSGGLQQQLAQEALNVPYEQYVQSQAYPYQNLSALESAAGLTAGAAGGTSSTTSPGPSTTSQLAGLGIAGLSLAGGLKKGGVIPHYDMGGNVALPNVPDVSLSYVTDGEPEGSPSFQSSIPKPPSSNSTSSGTNGMGVSNLDGLTSVGKGASKLFDSEGTFGSNGSLFGSTGLFGSQGLFSGIDSAISPGLAADMAGADSAVTGAGAAMSDAGFVDFLDLLALKNGGIAHYDTGGGIMGDLGLDGPYAGLTGTAADTYFGPRTTVSESDVTPVKPATPSIQLAPTYAQFAGGSNSTAPTGAATPYTGGTVSGLDTGDQAILSAIYAKKKSGGIAHYDDGGMVGGVAPPMPSANPLQSNNIAQKFAQMTPQQLQQLQMKLPPGSPQGAIVQKVLQQKRMMPNVGQGVAAGAPQGTSASLIQQQQMNKGGIAHFDDGGMAADSGASEPTDLLTQLTQAHPDIESQKDQPVQVDHSGDTVKVKSNEGTLDLGIPSHKDNVNTALLAAGLGIMAGKSPHALENIGTGGLEGVKTYNELQEKGLEAQEKQKQLQQTGAYQTGELGLRGQEINQTGAYQKGELANQFAERQKPIPDGFGGFIIPNPKDPTHPTQINGGIGAGNPSGTPPVDANGQPLIGDAYLATIDPRIAKTAKMVADGDMAFPSGFALKSPYWQTVISAATQYDPSTNGNRFSAVKSFNTGQQGNQTRFLNVATAHLDTLDKLTDALNNGDTKAINSLSNTFKSQFGQTAPTNFDTAKQIVGDEVTKAVIGAGGTGADREKAQKVIDSANSPEQLHQAVATYKTLMSGQLSGLQQQYEVSTGRKDFQDRYLTPAAKSALSPSAQTTASPQPIPQPIDRVVGKIYPTTLKGNLKWTGTGWINP